MSQNKRSGSTVPAGAFLVAVAALGVVVICALFTLPPRQAHAEEASKTTDIVLPAGQKLVSASWRCFAACDLWPLTRPMRKGEAAEIYTFTNRNGETYLIKETSQ